MQHLQNSARITDLNDFQLMKEFEDPSSTTDVFSPSVRVILITKLQKAYKNYHQHQIRLLLEIPTQIWPKNRDSIRRAHCQAWFSFMVFLCLIFTCLTVIIFFNGLSCKLSLVWFKHIFKQLKSLLWNLNFFCFK